jgi:hypothetical protein
MKVWLFTSLVLFVLVQFLQWLKGFMLPLPFYLLAGALLSLASNYPQEKLFPEREESPPLPNVTPKSRPNP